MVSHNVDVAALGLSPIELEDDEIVMGAVLIVRTSMTKDQIRIASRSTDLDWVTHRGLLECALDMHKEQTSGDSPNMSGPNDYDD